MTEIINIQLTGTANFTAVKTQIAALTAEMNKLNATAAKSGGFSDSQVKNLKSAEQQFLNSIAATRAFQVETVNLGTATDHLTTKLTRAKFSLGEYFSMMKQGNKGIVSDLMSVAEAQAKVVQSTVVPSATQQGMAHVVTNMNAQADAALKNKIYQQALNSVWAQGSTHLINLGKNTQWAGRQLTVGFAVPVAAAGAALGAMFYNVDKNLRMLQQVYGIGGQAGKAYSSIVPSSQEIAQIRSQVMALSQTMAQLYGQSVDETTGIAADLAAAGYTQQQLLDMTQTATKAMVLGETDRQSAVKATIAVQNTYRLSTGQTSEALNFFSAAQAATSTTMKDLIDAVPRVGPIVRNLGGSYKDLVGMLVAMKEGGVAASEGANAIKNSLLRIIDPTDKATKYLMHLGINIKAIVQQNKGDLVGTITALQSALQKLDPLVRQQAITELFGKFQASRMTALFDNFNRSGTQSYKIMQMQSLSAKQLADISQHMADQIKQTSSGAFKIALETLKAQLLPIGEQFLNIITWIINKFSDFIGVLKYLEPYKNIFMIILGGTAIAGPLLMISGLFMNLIGQGLKLVNTFRMFKQGFAEGFGNGGGIIGSFISGITGINNYFTATDKALVATRELADMTREASVDQATAINLLTEAIQNYQAAISGVSRMEYSTVLASATGQGGAEGGAAEGIIPSGPSGPISGPSAAALGAAAVASQRWGDVVIDSRGQVSFQPNSRSRLSKNAPVGTSLLSGQNKVWGDIINSKGSALAGQNFIMPNTSSGEMSAEEKNLRMAIINELVSAGAYTGPTSQNRLKAVANGNLGNATAQEKKLAEFLDLVVMQQQEWLDLESKHLAYLQTLVESDADFANTYVMLQDEYKQQLKIAREITDPQEKRAQMEALAVEYQEKVIALFEESQTYQSKYTTALETMTELAQNGVSDAEISAQNTAEVVRLSADLAATYEGINTAAQEMNTNLRAAAQMSVTGTATAWDWRGSKVADILNFHLAQNEKTLEVLNQREVDLSVATERLIPIVEESMVVEDALVTATDAVAAAREAQVKAIAEEIASEEAVTEANGGKGIRGFLRGTLGGKVGTGIGMLGMFAPMITQPLSSAVGGSAGAAISGAGTGALYGSMLGMFAGPEGAAIGAIGGALIGGVKSYIDQHAADIAADEQRRQDLISAGYKMSADTLATLGTQVKTFADVHLVNLTKKVSVNQQVVDQLANAYATATDSQTKAMMGVLGAPTGDAKKIRDLQYQLGKDIASKSYAYTGASGKPEGGQALMEHETQVDDAQAIADAQAQLRKDRAAARALYGQNYYSTLLATGSSKSAGTNLMALGQAAGMSGLALSSLVGGYQKSSGTGAAGQAYAIRQLMNQAGNDSQKLSDIMNNIITAVSPDKWAAVMNGAKGAGNAIFNNSDAFQNLIESIRTTDPELASYIDKAQAAGDSTQQIAQALNLYINGAISSGNALVAAAGNLASMAAIQYNYSKSSARSGVVSAAVAGLSTAATGGGGGGGGGSTGGSSGASKANEAAKKALENQIKAIQKEMDARKKNTQALQDATAAQEKLFELQNNIAKARNAGDLLGLALARQQYNDELNNQALTNKNNKLDAKDQAKIDALQAKLDKLNNASTGAGGGGGSKKSGGAAAGPSIQQQAAQVVGAMYDKIYLAHYLTADIAKHNPQIQAEIKKAMQLGVSSAKIDAVIEAAVKGAEANLFQQTDLTTATTRLKDQIVAAVDDGMQKGMTFNAAKDKALQSMLAQGTPDVIAWLNDPNIYRTLGIGLNGGVLQSTQSAWIKFGNWVVKNPLITGVSIVIPNGHGGVTTYRPTSGYSYHPATGGTAAAYGGLIVGPGTGTSDSISMRLSNGEYVMTAAATSRIGVHNLDAMNYGTKVGAVRGRSSISGSRSSGSAALGDVIYNVNVTVNGSNASADEIANAAVNKIKQMERANTTHRRVSV